MQSVIQPILENSLKPPLIQSAHIEGSAFQIVKTKQIIHHHTKLRDWSKT